MYINVVQVKISVDVKYLTVFALLAVSSVLWHC